MRKRIKIGITVVMLVWCAAISAQNREWKWARSSQNSNTANITTLSSDQQGNIYAGGTYAPPILSFGSNTIVNNSPGTNFFIVKYDADGNALWLRKATSLQCFLHSATTDADGNIFGVGHFFRDITLGNITLNTPSTWCMVIFMMDKDGNYIWAKSVGDSQRVTPSRIVTDSNGDLCVTGTFSCPSVAFEDFTLERVGIQDIFVAKYDNHGNVLWAKRAGGTAGQSSNALAVDDENNILITGDFTSSITFGSSLLTSSGSADIFVAKYDTNGNEIWATSMGGPDYDTASNIATDMEGNVIIAGDYYDDITIGNVALYHTGQADASDIFIAKYDMAGFPVWCKSLQGDLKDTCSGIATDALGNIVITGFFLSGTLHIEDSTILTNSTGQRQLYIAQFNPEGFYGWAENPGAHGNNHSAEIAIDHQQNIIIAGSYNEALSLGDNILGEPGNNAFVAKYGEAILGTDYPVKNEVLLYPNPASDTIYVSSNFPTGVGYVIHDIQGRTVQTGSISSGIVDVSKLSQGFYALSIGDNVSKFIKE
ncbi:T9SS type A sorting domain-containing protein [Flavobacterium selenitireducens]|uniref:T9SS type A sorting domain-containing protein n=1 Tax=Flavobacterium selenitireducens TaxID=2722704 RepID=UPI00168AC670|nr:T9SS type A sorting domain-containing protein [Flavobacterium selenitireducens]MBD3581311.1 T9SS type A sorting domain-containing protein [Flavobacterium selenitireducens]